MQEHNPPSDRATSPRVDTHLHVFHRGLACAPDARYRPDYDATLGQFLALMNGSGINRAVLVQPSFLGADNRYMLEALRAEPDRLRGVAVAEPTVTDRELAELDAAGVVGLRFNMIGREVAAYLSAERRLLANRVAQRGWHIEVQCRGEEMALVLDFAANLPCKVVIDHFGLPDGAGSGFDRLLRAPPNVLVKVSAPYRSPSQDHAMLVRKLRLALGPNRLLWGSDWPFTRYEAGRTYADCLDCYRQICPDPATRAAIDAAATALFGFR